MRNYPAVNWTWPNKQEVAAVLRAAIAVATADYPWLCNCLRRVDPAYEPDNCHQPDTALSELTQTMVANIVHAMNHDKTEHMQHRTTLWSWMHDQTPPRILYGPAGLELGWRQEWVAELLADLD